MEGGDGGRGCGDAVRACLVLLYLRGGPGGAAPRSGWLRVWRLLSQELPPLGRCSQALRQAGLWHEASLLDDARGLDAALAIVQNGRALTPLDSCYAGPWLAMGAAAPPCLWRRGAVQGPLMAVVGSREPSPPGAAGAREAASLACSQGWAVVTGGADGVDAEALDEAGRRAVPRAVVIHPTGLEAPEARRLAARWPWAMHLSPSPPAASFTSGQAMERNLLIYGGSVAAAACGPRWRRGGTWHGAAEALRRRLAPVAVLAGTGDPRAEQALAAMGAWTASFPFGASLALWASLGCPSGDGPQPSLFAVADAPLGALSLASREPEGLMTGPPPEEGLRDGWGPSRTSREGGRQARESRLPYGQTAKWTGQARAKARPGMPSQPAPACSVWP